MNRFSQAGSLALVAVVGILCVFFFPAATGPFTTTNGPATAFRAAAFANSLFAAIRAALGISASAVTLHFQNCNPVVSLESSAPALLALRC
jgi:hypothetical protein